MQLIERALRLLETQQAHLGVWLAAVPVVAAILIVALRRNPSGGVFRSFPACSSSSVWA